MNNQTAKTNPPVAIPSDFLTLQTDVVEGAIIVSTLGPKLYGEVDKGIVTLEEHKIQKAKIGKSMLPVDFWDVSRMQEAVRVGANAPQSKGIIRLIRELSAKLGAGSNDIVMAKFKKWFDEVKITSPIVSLKDLVFLYCYEVKDELVITNVLSYTFDRGTVRKHSDYAPVNGKFLRIDEGTYQVSEMSRRANAETTRFENPPCSIIYANNCDLEVLNRFSSEYVLLEHYDQGVEWHIRHQRMYKRGSTVTVTPKNRPGTPQRSITIASFVSDFVFQAMCHAKWRWQGLQLTQRGCGPMSTIVSEIRKLGTQKAPEFSASVALFNEAIRLLALNDVDDCRDLKFGTGANANVPTHLVSWREMNTPAAHASGLFMEEFGYQMILRASRFMMRRLHPSLATFYGMCMLGHYYTPVLFGLCLESAPFAVKVRYELGDENHGLQSSSTVMLEFFKRGGAHFLGDVDFHKIAPQHIRSSDSDAAVRKLEIENQRLRDQLALAKSSKKVIRDKDIVTREPMLMPVSTGMAEALKEWENASPTFTIGKVITEDGKRIDSKNWTDFDSPPATPDRTEINDSIVHHANDDDDDDKVTVIAVKKQTQQKTQPIIPNDIFKL